MQNYNLTLVERCFNTIACTENFIQLNTDAIKALPLDLIQRLLVHIVQTVQSKLITQTIALKIRLVRQNRLVTFRFPLHGTVGEILQQIYERASTTDGALVNSPTLPRTGLAEGNNNNNNSRDSYGLFQRSERLFTNSRWLNENKTLSYYDLKPGDVLEFRIKQTLLKIQFFGPWPTVKTFIVDESKTVQELVSEIGHKLQVKNPQQFSLQIKTEENGYVWLKPQETLPEQGIDTLSQTLLFRKKYFFHEYSSADLVDNEYLTKAFCEALDATIASLVCRPESAVQLAALQCQVRFGDCNVASESDFFLENWEEYLPYEYSSMGKKLSSDIFRSYKALAGTSEPDAKMSYLCAQKSLPTYGFTFFLVDRVSLREPTSILLGISKLGIMMVDPETKEVQLAYSHAQVNQWRVNSDVLTLEMIDANLTEDFQLQSTNDALTIAHVLCDYVQFAYRNKCINADEYRALNLSGANKSPTNSLKKKEGERLIRRLSFTNKTFVQLAEEPNTSQPTFNPNTKTSPLYSDPIKVTPNPLTGSNQYTLSDSLEDLISFAQTQSRSQRTAQEMDFCLKAIRSLSCLLNSLRNQSSLREIRVKFPNKTVKSFTVDENKSVNDIAYEVGEKVGIKNPEEFSFMKEDENEGWLNPYQTLQCQNVGENETLLFKKKFHYNDAFVSNNDPVYFNLLFCQSRDAVLSGMYACNLDEAVQLAATQFQINFGDHNPQIHQPGFLNLADLKHFLPADCLEFWGVTFQKLEKMIYKEHHKLRGIKEEYAKYRYLQLCRNLSTYGTVLFQVKLFLHKPKKGNFKLPSWDSMYVGFSRDSVSVLSKTKKVLYEFPLRHLRRWEHTADTVTLDFGDHPEGSFVFNTTEGDSISKYLSDYIDFIQRRYMAMFTFNHNVCKYPPESIETVSFFSEHCTWENGKRVFTSSFFSAPS